MTYQDVEQALVEMTGPRAEKVKLFLCFAGMQQDQAQVQTYVDLAAKEVRSAEFSRQERERAKPWIQETLAKREQLPAYLSR